MSFGVVTFMPVKLQGAPLGRKLLAWVRIWAQPRTSWPLSAVPSQKRRAQVCTSHLWRQVSKASPRQRVTYVGLQGTTQGLSVL